MRVRKKKHTAERIAAQSYLLCGEPEAVRADPDAPFPVKAPIRLEIGCGKGSFIVGESQRLADRNFYAMEVVSDVAVTALERAAAADPPVRNVRFIIANASRLEEYFPDHCLEAIYLNFSDPWPKAAHAKRRLTCRRFLSVYRKLLVPGGMLYFKTDNTGLFDFTLEELDAIGCEPDFVTRDLHHSERAAENVMTEYERNFTEKGQAICALSVAIGSNDDSTSNSM